MVHIGLFESELPHDLFELSDLFLVKLVAEHVIDDLNTF